MNDLLPLLIAAGAWIGAAELLIAYVLVSKGSMAGDSLRYQALNISGSLLLMTNCAYTGAWPSVIANFFYLVVGINILLTVKRAYIAQLSRRQGAELMARLRRSSASLPSMAAPLERA
ncbi:CBU_0592 family membrane protein [Actinomyces bowdenii]|uniref:CBU-0592-like domain-containing protein n=1 Tax=Actinomyces bowdenii TaxID=131109 RepID=A0A853EIJ4_9ACTO|nr:hypothetical protein [Actinomyces bowdenii]MBF0696392.1 hypothetical protein [Actinomyces bowdenii]MCR2051679.1 hypothetical protein [Actinomyces bowdenii]MDO5064086.1 hypothetical protein [Actinomyces bowdenii]NYS68565.1 hypothetical protein [Actinomyces bowdenii]